MKDEENERSYTVGYGKPAREHQWKRGQSGNPKGRPKGSKSGVTIIREINARPVKDNIITPDTNSKEALRIKAYHEALKGKYEYWERLGGFLEDDVEAQKPPKLSFTLKLEDNEDDPEVEPFH